MKLEIIIYLIIILIFIALSSLFFYLGYKNSTDKKENKNKAKKYVDGSMKNWWLSHKGDFFYFLGFASLLMIIYPIIVIIQN